MKKQKIAVLIIAMSVLCGFYPGLEAMEAEKKVPVYSQKHENEEKTEQNITDKEGSEKDRVDKEKSNKEDSGKDRLSEKASLEKAQGDKSEDSGDSLDSKAIEKKEEEKNAQDPGMPIENKENFDYSTVNFQDINEKDWFYYAALYCRNYRLIRGEDTVNFRPYSPVTREIFATMLWRLDREPIVHHQYNFKDVKNSWSKDAISWAVSNGMFTPYSEDTFKPNALVNTQDCVNILYRYTKYKNIDPGPLYTDFFPNPHYSKTDRYAWESLNWAISRNILPLEGDKFDSKKKLSRAKLCYIIRRYNEIVINKNTNLEGIYVGYDRVYPGRTYLNTDGVLMSRIQDLVRRRGKDINNMGIFIENLDTGEQFVSNPDKVFLAASTYKFPLALVVNDLILEGKLKFTDHFQFAQVDFEAGGPTGGYAVGSYISVDKLLSNMILYSDNTAARILYRNIGGWMHYHKLANKYSDSVDFYALSQGGNHINARFAHDCLKYLYLNSEKYPKLMHDMKTPMGFYYNSAVNGAEIVQKPGWIYTYKHCVAIVYSDTPYIIVIYTKDVNDKGIFNEINKIVYKYMNY